MSEIVQTVVDPKIDPKALAPPELSARLKVRLTQEAKGALLMATTCGTQDEIATLLGTSRPYVSRIMRGLTIGPKMRRAVRKAIGHKVPNPFNVEA